MELKGRLSLKPGSTVVARNELRVTEGGELKMDGGSVESTRWLENELYNSKKAEQSVGQWEIEVYALQFRGNETIYR